MPRLASTPSAAAEAAVPLVVGSVGAGGDGVAALPGGGGGVAHIPYALPGERVLARGRETEALLDASPDRVAPPCAHFPPCGGCVLQHWAAAPYLDWKRSRLAEALSRAGFRDAPVAATVACPPHTRRRADLAVRRGGSGGVALGFHARGDASRVVDLRECHVLDPRLAALVTGPALRDALRRLRGLRREGSAVLTLLDTGPDLLVRTDAPLAPEDRAILAAFATANGVPRVSWALRDGPAENAAARGPATLRLSGVEVAPPPAAFLQATPEGEAAIVAAVLAGLPARLPPRARVADLYAGLGTLSFPLSARARVEAFEGDAAAVAALSAAAGRAGAKVNARRRDLARQPLAPAELAPYAAVVLDPPYAGAAEQCALLARCAVPRVVVVSCNPAALGRDLAPFARSGAWRVLAATPVDQFVWSAHLESVVVLARADARG